MENINNFLAAAQAYGVRSEDLFQTVSLYEGSNMTQVCIATSMCHEFISRHKKGSGADGAGPSSFGQRYASLSEEVVFGTVASIEKSCVIMFERAFSEQT